MNLDEILQKVQELKQENGEKDEVIRVQLEQINELEGKVGQLEGELGDLRHQLEEQQENARQSEDMLNKLREALS